ncbi:MAG TPA: cytochrome c oxidase assembly protein [bacterium]|nr:cytochrome c oxidase assembly protein [bacterium]
MTATLRWTDWSWDPPIVAAIISAAAVYVWILRSFPVRDRRPLYFWGGCFVLVVALLSPVHAGAAYLFTLHMVQHMLLMIVAPPLLVLGMPATLIGWVYQRAALRRLYRELVSPAPVTILYNGILLFWHLPAAYDATLRSPTIHALEHASFVAGGLLFWGIIASPSPRLAGASVGMRLVMIGVADVVNFMLGFYLAFADHPLYVYYTVVPRLWGLSPLDDLRLGGAAMWVMGQMMYAIPLLALLYWFLWRGGEREGASARPAT